MNHNHLSEPYSAQRPRVPVLVWVVTAGLALALIAVFVFNVAWTTVGYYGLIAVFIGSHFFMHGGHGGHGAHARNETGAESDPAEAGKNEHAGHSGGCH